MTIQEAKQLMTPEAKQKLHELISKPEEIDVSKKVGNDVIMAAFCQAVMEGVIQPCSLSPKLTKLLNSDTNTISDIKLDDIMKVIHKNQPDMVCDIRICKANGDPWYIFRLYEDFRFVSILLFVKELFSITPQMVRMKLQDTLKTTIVNNVSQLISKIDNSTEEERMELRVSITTITRLVNMTGHICMSKFVDGVSEHDNALIILGEDDPEFVSQIRREHPDITELIL